MSEMTCEQLRELDAELALDILPARERARAVAHLDRCPGCRGHIEQLAQVGDGLLGLLPGTEPPVGFESRVTAGLQPAPQQAPPQPVPQPAPARRRLLRPRVAVAAAALAVACGFAGWAAGTVIEQASGPASPTAGANGQLLQAPLMAAGGEVGRVFAHPGQQGWVYMSVDLEKATPEVSCVLVNKDGTTTRLGTFSLQGGYGYWVAAADVNPTTLAGANLLTPDGTVLAKANFA
ncbi:MULTISPECIES: anti-sigma factor family protein [unclassified Streptomyces]|uniref:anti-sigma factor family protein n=1 Tax=unclassified Streptomyces TaxID=2593676 RepID=UPI0022522679|nr:MULTISPECIES: zf-HC2 domain-containing protein [unclassified Streptomyces]MCX5145654.1 zf-HC2 domain-containing protein [Streptomyces sp. NBC_00320]WSN48934.1 zf-HC2 domain-containing protein [Streptomyces sp. NBC_01296]WSW61658.1 zf-HC2 domain-containing protein [Streptomyces sp. NBC_00998]